MMSNMNPNEIKKGLEDLVEQATDVVAWHMNRYGAEEVYITVSNALAYINQLEAKVERYKDNLNAVLEERADENIKSEAIKEFCEKRGIEYVEDNI